MSDLEPIIQHDVIRQFLSRLIDLADKRPPEDRVRDVMQRLSPKSAPLFFKQESYEDKQFAWKMLESLAEENIIRIDKPNKTLHSNAPFEDKPQIRLTDIGEELLRISLNRPLPSLRYAMRWRQAILALDTDSEGELEPLSRCPIEIAQRSLQEVIEKIRLLMQLPSDLFAREASAQAFWGSSKILDSDARLAAVNLARGSKGAFRASPILLNVTLPKSSEPKGILFIENEATYHRAVFAKNWIEKDQLALVWSAGFKASSNRIRNSKDISIHFGYAEDLTHATWFLSQLQNSDGGNFWFFGDLDYSGLAILTQLRSTYPKLTAWRPGYDSLLELLESSLSHTPEEVGKERQRDSGSTGCLYADQTLRPALMKHRRFVDQEAWTP